MPAWLRRRRRPADLNWELKVTTPDGILLELTTQDLHALWRSGCRSNDGYLDILEMPRLHLWVRPAGWTEPDRAALLDGTGTLAELRRSSR